MIVFAWRLAMYGFAVLMAVMLGLWGASSVFFILTHDEKFVRQAFPWGLIGGLSLGLAGVCYSFYGDKLEEIREQRERSRDDESPKALMMRE